MALTLDGTAPMPLLGSTGSGTGLAAGAGVIGGLLLGSLLNNNGNGLFGNGNNNNGGGIAYDSLQNQIAGVSGQISSGGLHSEINELEKSLESANLANLQGISQNALTYQSGNSSLMTAQATGNFTTLQSINDLGRDISAQSNQNALQQLNSFNGLTTTMLQGFNGAAMQTQNTTNQIITQGTALSSQLAQCCCEIRAAIAADGQATRALINDGTIQALRDKNAELAVKVSNNDQNQYLLSTILAHFHPTPVVVQ